MSTSTPTQDTPKGPRRSARRQKRFPYTEDAESGLTSSETDIAKLNDLSLETTTAHRPKEAKERRKSQVKKHHDQSNAQVITQSTTKLNHTTKPDKVVATPSKQAYAASTFLNSPAPSMLPIPSFYSKSVPTKGTESPSIIPEEGSPSKEPENGTTILDLGPERHRESTPLDFLFDAARKARGTPRGQSPTGRSNSVSVRGDSPYNRSPAPREGDVVFLFELDDKDERPELGAVASSTPFKERIDALRPQSSPSPSTAHDSERKAKTEALKRLLMNSQTPRTASAAAQSLDPNNPFNARPPQPQNLHHPQPHYRHRSGPSTPAPASEQQPPPFPPTGLSGQNNGRNYMQQTHVAPSQRPQSSQLRNIYQPQSDTGPAGLSSNHEQTAPLISTARKHDLRSQSPRHAPINTQYREQTPEHMTNHRASSSAQQLEDDLRRVLKLDLASKG